MESAQWSYPWIRQQAGIFNTITNMLQLVIGSIPGIQDKDPRIELQKVLHKMIIYLIYNLTNGFRTTGASRTYLQQIGFQAQKVVPVGGADPTFVLQAADEWFQDRLFSRIRSQGQKKKQSIWRVNHKDHKRLINGKWVHFSSHLSSSTHGIAVGTYFDPEINLFIILYADQGTNVGKDSGIRVAILPNLPLNDSDNLQIGDTVQYLDRNFRGTITQRTTENITVQWTSKKQGESWKSISQGTKDAGPETLPPQYIAGYQQIGSYDTLENEIFKKQSQWNIVETLFPEQTRIFLFPLPKQKIPICGVLSFINRIKLGLTLYRLARNAHFSARTSINKIEASLMDELVRTHEEIQHSIEQIIDELIEMDRTIVYTRQQQPRQIPRQQYSFYS